MGNTKICHKDRLLAEDRLLFNFTIWNLNKRRVFTNSDGVISRTDACTFSFAGSLTLYLCVWGDFLVIYSSPSCHD